MSNGKQIADTILAQLGGHKFIVMTGAKNMMYAEAGLHFKIGSGTLNKATHCHIDLDQATDLYTVKFFRVRGTKCATLLEQDRVPAEALREMFTQHTGFQTSLGTCGK